MTSTNPNGVIIAKGGPAEGFALTLESGLPNFHIRSASKLSTVTGKKRLVGGWHHVVGVLKDTLDMELYIDGELAGTGKASGFLTKDPAQGLEIAADLGSGVGEYQSPFGFTGVIDEVRIYFQAATAEAIKQRYDSDVEIGPDPKLVVTFDDGSARDLSLYRNNGTIENGIPIDGHTGKGIRFSNNAARLNVSEDDDPPKAGGKQAGNKARQNANTPNNANNNGNAKAGNQAGKGNNTNKQQNGSSLIKPKWTSDIPVYARAMVLAGDELFVAGPLDMIDEEETFKKLTEKDAEVQKLLTAQDDALNGGVGGLLLSINCGSGEIDGRIELGTLPSWDGMAGAAGKLFLSTVDGQVVCYGPKQ